MIDKRPERQRSFIDKALSSSRLSSSGGSTLSPAACQYWSSDLVADPGGGQGGGGHVDARQGLARLGTLEGLRQAQTGGARARGVGG
jgi:hypothetical protein